MCAASQQEQKIALNTDFGFKYQFNILDDAATAPAGVFIQFNKNRSNFNIPLESFLTL